VKGGEPVDGQNGNYRPRTAGEQKNAAGPDGGVRDWQRNTWFGPAPLNNNPFDEPEDAPELKESRSENVTEHVGEFWNTPGTGYQNTVPTRKIPEGNGHIKNEKKKKHPKALRLILGTVLFLTAVFLVLRFAVFSVKQIVVTGNSAITAEEIIRISGIRRGDSILTLNEKAVEERIVSDYRLQFRYMAREMPGTVILSIREREPCCWLTYCGIMYVMDKNRMVLYESENPDERPIDLVEVKGIEVRSNTMVGQYVNLGNEQQKSIFRELFQEMKVLNCIDKIADADISNTNSILLATRNGFTVALGDGNNIHAKLRSMLLVQDKLVELGYSAGTINVTNPEKPMFIPE
jgi:cell division protein FtsQ